MDELPEILAGIFKQLEKWELINEKLDKLPYMVKEVVSLRDEVNAVNEMLSIHRGELDEVNKKQKELDQDIQIIRKLPQRDEISNKLDERLQLYVRDIHETLEYHQRYIKSIDNQRREKNIIFHGVPESPTVELGSGDMDKIKNVIQK